LIDVKRKRKEKTIPPIAQGYGYPCLRDHEVDAAWEECEVKFESARNKIEGAVEDLERANNLAIEFDIKIAARFNKIDVLSLLSQLTEAGWSHSSLEC